MLPVVNERVARHENRRRRRQPAPECITEATSPVQGARRAGVRRPSERARRRSRGRSCSMRRRGGRRARASRGRDLHPLKRVEPARVRAEHVAATDASAGALGRSAPKRLPVLVHGCARGARKRATGVVEAHARSTSPSREERLVEQRAPECGRRTPLRPQGTTGSERLRARLNGRYRVVPRPR